MFLMGTCRGEKHSRSLFISSQRAEFHILLSFMLMFNKMNKYDVNRPALPKPSSREQQQLVGYIDMVGYQIDHKVN